MHQSQSWLIKRANGGGNALCVKVTEHLVQRKRTRAGAEGIARCAFAISGTVKVKRLSCGVVPTYPEVRAWKLLKSVSDDGLGATIRTPIAV